MKSKKKPLLQQGGKRRKAEALARATIRALGDRPDDVLVVVLFVERLARRNRRNRRRH